MAINTNPGTPARQVSTFNASGNLAIPAGQTVCFVSVHGATGGGGGGSTGPGRYGTFASGGNGGSGAIVGAYVQLIPSSTIAIAIGAAGVAGATNNQGAPSTSGGSGGTTTFDSTALIVAGSGGGGGIIGNYSNTNGNAGSSVNTGNGATNLSTLSVSGAVPKTGTITVSGTTVSGGLGGVATRYSGVSTVTAGTAGQVHVYF